MTVTINQVATKAQLVKFYREAEKRATVVAGKDDPQGGRAFSEVDRVSIVMYMDRLNISIADLAYALAPATTGPKVNDYHRHTQRLTTFQRQVKTGKIRMASPAEQIGTAVHKPAATNVVAIGFDGRIKTYADIQPAFNKAAVQLVKLGITNPAEAAAYLANGFQHALTEQKIEIKAERVLGELRLGSFGKSEMLTVLDRVKAQL